jgi:hypothetical protein
MLFKTGKAAGIFLKHKAKSIFGKVKQSPKRKALFNKLKGKMQTGKLKSEYDRILQSASKAGSKGKAKAAQILKGQKEVATEYKGSFFKTFARDARVEGRGLRKVAKKIPNTVMKYPITTGAGVGIAIGASGDKSIKLKKSDPNYKALKRAGYI